MTSLTSLINRWRLNGIKYHLISYIKLPSVCERGLGGKLGENLGGKLDGKLDGKLNWRLNGQLGG